MDCGKIRYITKFCRQVLTKAGNRCIIKSEISIYQERIMRVVAV